MADTDGVETLNQQYETYPYPPRDPADEANRLVTGSPSQLAELNHYVFAGRRDFSKPFRALVAGGGTGDAAIMLAQQLADTGGPGNVVYLDLSSASRAIAEARAEARGLSNISFYSGSLLDISSIAPGPYDYIDCCGVLHHLSNPSAGLKSLCDVLSDDGGMGVMVYAPLGRNGVYHVQEMLRSFDLSDSNPVDQVAFARKLLENLPSTNWLKRNSLVGDHLNEGDAGLYDLLLHSQDRAYSVSELNTFIGEADMRITTFIAPFAYDPSHHVEDEELASKFETMSWIERCAFTELLTGSLKTHIAYLVKSKRGDKSVATVDDTDLAPILVGLEPKSAANALRDKGQLNAELEGLRYSFPITHDECAVLELFDGHRTQKDICAALSVLRTDFSEKSATQSFRKLFKVLNGLNLSFLRKP
ncbi:MAG: methyltransferase [Rhodospirillaceae bacterium]|nr:methyltransferase [Rhodospirillaceae bacterium]|tara:strand:+ start:17069 stop:18322 length:1254 start_codon:yes stop_codon:yes gene_type:complete